MTDSLTIRQLKNGGDIPFITGMKYIMNGPFVTRRSRITNGTYQGMDT